MDDTGPSLRQLKLLSEARRKTLLAERATIAAERKVSLARLMAIDDELKVMAPRAPARPAPETSCATLIVKALAEGPMTAADPEPVVGYKRSTLSKYLTVLAQSGTISKAGRCRWQLAVAK